MTLHPHPYRVLYTNQLCQSDSTLVRVNVFDHHGRLPVTAIRNKNTVSLQLVEYSHFFKYFLNPQHFLNLIANGQLIFKNECYVFTQLDSSIFLV